MPVCCRECTVLLAYSQVTLHIALYCTLQCIIISLNIALQIAYCIHWQFFSCPYVAWNAPYLHIVNLHCVIVLHCILYVVLHIAFHISLDIALHIAVNCILWHFFFMPVCRRELTILLNACCQITLPMIGELGFLISEYACVTLNNASFSFIHQA